MVTVGEIKLLLDDQVLAALTPDNEDTINEELIQKLIDDAKAFIGAIAQLSEAIEDEYIRNIVLYKLYLLAGLDEKAKTFQRSAEVVLKASADIVSKANEDAIRVQSNDRYFPDGWDEPWRSK